MVDGIAGRKSKKLVGEFVCGVGSNEINVESLSRIDRLKSAIPEIQLRVFARHKICMLVLESLENFSCNFTLWRDSIEPDNEVVNLVLPSARLTFASRAF